MESQKSAKGEEGCERERERREGGKVREKQKDNNSSRPGGDDGEKPVRQN